MVAVSPETLTDIQRAARCAYLQRLSFGGKPAHDVSPGQMGSNAHHPAKLRAERMRRLIAAAHQRLQGVHVECLDWDVFIGRFDRPWTLYNSHQNGTDEDFRHFGDLQKAVQKSMASSQGSRSGVVK